MREPYSRDESDLKFEVYERDTRLMVQGLINTVEGLQIKLETEINWHRYLIVTFIVGLFVLKILNKV